MRRSVYTQVVNPLIGNEVKVEWREGEELKAVKFWPLNFES